LLAEELERLSWEPEQHALSYNQLGVALKIFQKASDGLYQTCTITYLNLVNAAPERNAVITGLQ